jgi:pyruvate,water dikinase
MSTSRTQTQTAEYTLPLADPRATLERAGGKGASLARLAQAGLPVPGGFHVTTEAYGRFVADNGLRAAVLEAVQAVRPAEPATLETAAQTIGDLFERAVMPSEIGEAIARAYAALSGDAGDQPAVAVRSSGTAEDLPDLSFAGQQETYLNVRGPAAVQDAVKRCWASLWTARAIGYRGQHGLDPQLVSLAVVVQVLVPAEAAGVLFTANPISGARDQAMITATWGLGEALVSSAVTPDTLVVAKDSGRVVDRQTADTQEMTALAAGGTAGTEERPTPEALRHAPVLDDRQAAALNRLGVQIEALYGMPMDVEWAVPPAGPANPANPANGLGGFAILQARPITALPPAPAPPLEWKRPKPNGKYARSSIIELLPEPLTPLFGSLGLREANRAYDRFGKLVFKSSDWLSGPLVVRINDYAYYDTTFTPGQTLKVLVRIPWMVKFLLGTAETRWKDEGRPRLAQAVAHWQGAQLDALPARELLRGVRDLLAATFDYYIYTVQGGILPAAYMSETAFAAFYDRLVRRADDPPALTFVLGFDSLPIQAEKSLYDLGQSCRERPALADLLARTSASQVAGWLSGAAALPADAPREDWAAFRDRFAAHQTRFGHAIYDLDFAKATPADDPTPLLETLKHVVQGQGADPYRRQQEAAQRREEAVRRVGARLRGWRRGWFLRLLRWAQRYAPLREDSLGDAGLGWPLVRRMLLELGRRLAAAVAVRRAEDVFWLTDSELDGLAADLDRGGARLSDRMVEIDDRKARVERESRHTPPPSLPQRVTFAGLDFSRWLPARAEQQTGNTIKGLGASPGQVTATARVLRGPEDFGQMRQGDVLVAAITTPAWTPLFALAAGVVTDVGGPLSHSSIVAREYGVPAVLGTGVATRRIHSGDVITVDGSAGVVTLPGAAGRESPHSQAA